MTWTDPNTHDPGITTLEVLAYGLATFGIVRFASRRVVGAPCGRPCALLIAVGVAAVVAARRAARDHG